MANLSMTNPEQTKAEQTKAEQTKAEQTKAEQTKAEQTKAEQTKAEPKPGILTPSGDVRLFESDDAEKPKWERLPDESGAHYGAFVIYRDLGRTRTIREAYQIFYDSELEKGHNKHKPPESYPFNAPRHWLEMSRLHDWRERAESYDDWLELAARERRLKEQDAEIEEFRQRARTIAIAKTNLGAKFLTFGDTMLAAMRKRDSDAEKQRVENVGKVIPRNQEILPTPLDDYRVLTVIIKNASVVTDSGMDNEAAMVGITRLQNILDEQERNGDTQ